jgi:hypothetical protein
MRIRFGLGYIVIFAAKRLIDRFGLCAFELEGHFLECGVFKYQIDDLPFNDLILQYVPVAAFFDLRPDATRRFVALGGD